VKSEQKLQGQLSTQRAALALALVAIGSAALIHGWSDAASALRRGGACGVFLVSDAIAAPTRTQAVWVRYDPGEGTLDATSVPPHAVLDPAQPSLRVHGLYVQALQETRQPGAATEMVAGRIARALDGCRGGKVFFLHLDAAGVQALTEGPVAAAATPATDRAALQLDPALERADRLLRGVLDKPAGFWRLARAVAAKPGVTNLSAYDLAVFGQEALGLRRSALRAAELPLDRRGWVLQEGLRRLWGQAQQSRPILAEVLNASSRAAAAAVLTRRLRARGVDVVYYGNLGTPLQRTWILDRSGDRQAVTELQKLLPAAEIRSWTVLAPERLLHASILIGEDWEKEVTQE